MVLLSNSFHEEKDLFSRQKIFFFMKKNIFLHEKKFATDYKQPSSRAIEIGLHRLNWFIYGYVLYRYSSLFVDEYIHSS